MSSRTPLSSTSAASTPWGSAAPSLSKQSRTYTLREAPDSNIRAGRPQATPHSNISSVTSKKTGGQPGNGSSTSVAGEMSGSEVVVSRQGQVVDSFGLSDGAEEDVQVGGNVSVNLLRCLI